LKYLWSLALLDYDGIFGLREISKRQEKKVAVSEEKTYLSGVTSS